MTGFKVVKGAGEHDKPELYEGSWPKRAEALRIRRERVYDELQPRIGILNLWGWWSMEEVLLGDGRTRGEVHFVREHGDNRGGWPAERGRYPAERWPTMRGDEELMLAVAEGDLGAFEQIVLRHQNSAWSAAYRFLGDHAEAEDVAQEVFLKILGAAPRYRPTASFRTYLYRVVTRLCLDWARKARPVVANNLADTAADDHSTLNEMIERDRDRGVFLGHPGLFYGSPAMVAGRPGTWPPLP